MGRGAASARPKRRETAATRRRRAQLCRERQGPDGKWETNAKKAAVRRARRTSLRLAPLLARSQERRLKEVASALAEAHVLTSDLAAVDGDAALQRLLPRLEGLMVTKEILQKTRIPKALQSATERAGASKGAVKTLLLKWRQAFRMEQAQARSTRAEAAEKEPCGGAPKAPAAAAPAAAASATAAAAAAAASRPLPIATPARAASGPPAARVPPAARAAPPAASCAVPTAAVVVVDGRVPARRPPKQRRITTFFQKQE